MKSQDRIAICKDILQKRQSISEEKKGVNNDVNSIRLSIQEAIMNEDDKVNLKKMLQEEISKEAYRKHLNAKINSLEAQLNDVIMGTGEYNADQLDLFDLVAVKNEFNEYQKKEEKGE